MISGEQIRQAINSVVKQYLRANTNNSIACTVKTVSAGVSDGVMTFDCAPINGNAIIEDVKLCANYNVDTNAGAFILVPAIDSIVIVSFSDDKSPYLSMVSQVSQVYLNGSDKGGLVGVNEIVSKLNNLETKVNSLITFTQSHTHAGVTVGSGVSGVTATPVTGNLTPTIKSDLENTTVKHGIGTII